MMRRRRRWRDKRRVLLRKIWVGEEREGRGGGRERGREMCSNGNKSKGGREGGIEAGTPRDKTGGFVKGRRGWVGGRKGIA